MSGYVWHRLRIRYGILDDMKRKVPTNFDFKIGMYNLSYEEIYEKLVVSIFVNFHSPIQCLYMKPMTSPQ